MSAPQLSFSFPHTWTAKILQARPVILPARHFVYPSAVEEVERGALEVFVRPNASGVEPFLATCALGFRDPIVPSGLWSAPNPDHLCAVSGGYAYLIDTTAPERFAMPACRPALQVIAVPAHLLLLFAGSRTVLAWGPEGQAWESPKLSDEGISGIEVGNGRLRGIGWNMTTDKETNFALDLLSGELCRD